MKRPGFSILEILIGMVILGVALAVIGNISRTAFRSARASQTLTQAELLCESILALIRLELIDLEPVTEEPITEEHFPDLPDAAAGHSEPEWVYTIEVEEIDEYGLLELAVTVRQNPRLYDRPAACRLVRWMVDPELEKEDDEEDDETTGTTSTSQTQDASSGSGSDTSGSGGTGTSGI